VCRHLKISHARSHLKDARLTTPHIQDQAATEATLKDGWLYSGDLGRIDEEGFLHITGRKKDIIITAGGKNITPANIEHAIKAHPLVRVCGVCGACVCVCG
jgi:long-chain acyl-CoA synthetase